MFLTLPMKVEIMETVMELRDVGLRCFECKTVLPLPLNPLPFPGVYFCPNKDCKKVLIVSLEDIELQ
jgi:hypothetical protein